MRISGIEERIIESIREDGEYKIDNDMAYYCQNCECMQLIDTELINGRVGHIDNWLPDEYIQYCQECGKSIGE
jgi:hypothetical protein